MRHSIFILTILGATLFGCSGDPDTAAATPGASSRQASDVPQKLVGPWTGTATIVNDWTIQKQLPLDLNIAADGSVTGTVGDANLVEAQLKPSRSSIERSLGWGRDWRIHAKLQGDLIASEKLHRDAIDIVFDQIDDKTLSGGATSSGGEFGGKKSAKLAAGNMTLRPATKPAAQ